MAKSAMKYDYGTSSLTAEEIILEIEKDISSICSTLSDCDGDLTLVLWQKLMDCMWRLIHIRKQIEETD
jgi:hypothetical protein